MPFEQDYLCATCKQTDRSCPLRDYAVQECSFYAPDLPNVYQPSRKPAMTEYAAVDAMLQELERAKAKHPQWPTNTLEQARERAAAIKRESNTCEVCGKKGSQATDRRIVDCEKCKEMMDGNEH